ncbi:MAG: hypothetical protein Q8M15_16995 [Bacteroidota bacterium]|nr:hypothetical protein [Bacteroidota bacterium]
MKYIIVLIICCLSKICTAQDLIYKKDKTVLNVSIVAIGPENIVYRDNNSQTGPAKIISKSEVVKIKTAKGKEMYMDQGINTSLDDKNVIKVDVFAYASSKFVIGYERSISPTKTWEIQLGHIGTGQKDDDITKLNGAFIRFGFKFKRSPEYYSNLGKSSHLLKGSYFKPELVFGGFSEERKTYDWYNNPWFDPYTYTRRTVSFACVMFNIGKQWTIGDMLAIDYYFGMGIGTATRDNTDLVGYNYAIVGTNPVYFQSGLKLGLMF